MVENKLVLKKSKFRLFLEKNFGKNAGDIIFNIFNYLLFAILIFVCFYPFFHVVKTSLVSNKLVDGVPTKVISFEAYIEILNNDGLLRAFLLSIGIVAVYVVLHVFFTVLSAYPLSKKNLKGKKAILLLLVFFPFLTTIINKIIKIISIIPPIPRYINILLVSLEILII